MGFLKNNGHKFALGVLPAMTMLVLFSTVALASYMHHALLNTYIAASGAEFYFTSDLLTDQTTVPAYQITHDWQTGADANIRFQLRNFENPLHISNREISYIVVPEPVGASISGTIPPGGSEGQIVTISVPSPANPNMPLEVTVTATATSPYSKTLQGKFIITPAISYQMAENAGSPVAVLTINLAPNTEFNRDVMITWPEGANPDMTNPIVIGRTIEERTLTTSLNTAAIYELVFFKNHPEDDYGGVTVTGL
ncbi:hypothetical protein [Candidatus Formimonas warabiya]|uniref:Uncharacterized protein n=1 Tax=Formimonas warabiya TaxID=1761012 RepID=A0A3G1KLU2_FORW1|nr:hypothetical protein [Candidatus Formimonas warabiya]ATW23436.1 hypothetical protein DCMF_00270 [Candidatus Formimonas warabiya]